MRRPATILVAAGSDAERAQLVALLTQASRRIEAVGDGEAALAYLRAKTPDLIVVDAGLPGLGGVELCFRVKRVAQLRRVPVLLLSFPVDEHDRHRIERSGADRLVTRPLAEQELKRAVRQLLPGRDRSTTV